MPLLTQESVTPLPPSASFVLENRHFQWHRHIVRHSKGKYKGVGNKQDAVAKVNKKFFSALSVYVGIYLRCSRD